MTLEQFKKGITRRANILRSHGLMDPADRVVAPRKYVRTAPVREKEPKLPNPDLLDELFKE